MRGGGLKWRGRGCGAGRLSYQLFFQNDDTLKMAGLGKEVEGLDGGEFVVGVEEFFQVAHLAGGVAGDVDDTTGAEGEELGEEFLIAAFAWGVNNDDGFVGGEGDVTENGLGGGGEEGSVLYPVKLGVAACPIGGGFADFDAGDFFKFVGEA